MPKQCPKCGQTPAKAKPFIDKFCSTCYFQQNPLITLKERALLNVCPRCDAYWSGGRWVHRDNNPLNEHVLTMVCTLLDPLLAPSQPATFEIQLMDQPDSPITREKTLQVEITAKAQDSSHQEKQVLSLPINSRLCNQCKRTSGGYFEATLQVRTSTGKLTPTQEEAIVTHLKQRLVDLSLPPNSMKLSPTKAGLDAKFLSSRVARSLAKGIAETFGLILGVSSKVTGRTRDGKTQRRETFLVRYPPITTGDVFAQRGHIYLVVDLRNGRYIVVDLDKGHRRSYSPNELATLEGQKLNDQVHEYQVVSKSEGFYQLMRHPDYTMFDLPTPPFPMTIGSMVQAIEWKNRLLIIPEKNQLKH